MADSTIPLDSKGNAIPSFIGSAQPFGGVYANPETNEYYRVYYERVGPSQIQTLAERPTIVPISQSEYEAKRNYSYIFSGDILNTGYGTSNMSDQQLADIRGTQVGSAIPSQYKDFSSYAAATGVYIPKAYSEPVTETPVAKTLEKPQSELTSKTIQTMENAPTNFQEYYAQKKAEYATELNAYNKAGIANEPVYQDLLARKSQLDMLSKASVGLETFQGILKQSGFLETPTQIKTVVKSEPTVMNKFLDNISQSSRTTFSALPGGMIVSGAIDTAVAVLNKDVTKIPFYQTYQAVNANTDILPKIGATYSALNVDLSKYTTDTSGIAEKLSKTNIDLKPYGDQQMGYTETANFVKNTYVSLAQSPVDLAVSFGAGGLYSTAKAGLGYAVAKSAMSELPVISTVGKLASSPIATDIGVTAEKVVGGIVIAEAGKNVIDQPTPETKGTVLGKTIAQFTGFGAGMNAVSYAAPENVYSGQKFFSGEYGRGPIEALQFKIGTTIRSTVTSEPAAYRDIAKIAPVGRFEEPTITATPDIAATSKSGKYATEIKSVLQEQPSSMIGSATVKTQYAPEILEKVALRDAKDVDALIQTPEVALTSLQSKTGLSKAAAEGVLDLHPIPKDYPALKPSTVGETVSDESSFFQRLFGDPYAKLAFPRGINELAIVGRKYSTGTTELTYERIQTQYGRKAAAAALVIESPISKGYRAEKDIYDFVTQYEAQKMVGIKRGVPESKYSTSDKAMKDLMERELTIGTVKGQKGLEAPVKTVKIKELYEAGKKSKTETPAEQYVSEKGISSKLDIRSSLGTVLSTKSYALTKSSKPYVIAKSSTSPSVKSVSPSVVIRSSVVPRSPTPSSVVSTFKSPSITSPSMKSPSPKSPSIVSPSIKSPSPSPKSPSPSVPSRYTSVVPSRYPSPSPSKSPSPSSFTGYGSSKVPSPSISIVPPSPFGKGGNIGSGEGGFGGRKLKTLFTEKLQVGKGLTKSALESMNPFKKKVRK